MSRCVACNAPLDKGEELLTKENGQPEDMCFECLSWIDMEEVGIEKEGWDELDDE